MEKITFVCLRLFNEKFNFSIKNWSLINWKMRFVRLPFKYLVLSTPFSLSGRRQQNQAVGCSNNLCWLPSLHTLNEKLHLIIQCKTCSRLFLHDKNPKLFFYVSLPVCFIMFDWNLWILKIIIICEYLKVSANILVIFIRFFIAREKIEREENFHIYVH